MRVRRPDHTGIALAREVRLVGKAPAAGQQPRILAPPNRLADPLRRDLLSRRTTSIPLVRRIVIYRSMLAACEEIGSARTEIFNTDLGEMLELDNMLAQASVSLHSAIGRRESRGAHAREDFPTRDDENWLKHTLCWRDDDGRVRLDYRPVHLQPLSNEVSSIPPKERVY